MTSAVLAFLIAFKPFLLEVVASPGPLARATVVVETPALREAGAGPAIASRVKSSAAAVLRGEQIADDGGPDDPVLAVTVRPLARGEIGYASTITVRKAGRRLPQSYQRCSLCTESELVARVERSLVRLAPRLAALVRE